MPNTKSARRRVRRTIVDTKKNKLRKNKYKAAVKKMQQYIDGGKTSEAKKFLPKFYSELMKVAKTGTISKKTASRKISKITKKINSSKK